MASSSPSIFLISPSLGVEEAFQGLALRGEIKHLGVIVGHPAMLTARGGDARVKVSGVGVSRMWFVRR